MLLSYKHAAIFPLGIALRAWTQSSRAILYRSAAAAQLLLLHSLARILAKEEGFVAYNAWLEQHPRYRRLLPVVGRVLPDSTFSSKT